MVRVNITLDEFTDKMLKVIAIEAGTSRSSAVRELVKEKIERDKGRLELLGKILVEDEV